MRSTLYWFRNDLRLHDARALQEAVAHAHARQQSLLLVCVHDPAQEAETPWGFRRMGPHRRRFLAETWLDLQVALGALGQQLVVLQGDPVTVLADLAQRFEVDCIFCEAIAAPEEQAQVMALQARQIRVHSTWQSSLLEPESLPFDVLDLPAVFTPFRQLVERAGTAPLPPLAPLTSLPAPPAVHGDNWPGQLLHPTQWLQKNPITGAAGADFKNTKHSNTPQPTAASAASASSTAATTSAKEAPAGRGGESAALAHLAQYLTPPWPDRYKQTRNALQGQHTSSHWSPWLATGAVSARTVWAHLQHYEKAHGANDGTYWLWFELLWRDYFRFLHLQHGRQLYVAKGLSQLPRPSHFPKDFQRWCDGNTGEPIVDAGMRELAATGYTSNRMRQIVASYLVHDLACDWRAGAAWFESQLIDFDVYSNQGNWLYISGRGTDPRQGRRFNPAKQTQDHDAEGRYRQRWLGR